LPTPQTPQLIIVHPSSLADLGKTHAKDRNTEIKKREKDRKGERDEEMMQGSEKINGPNADALIC